MSGSALRFFVRYTAQAPRTRVRRFYESSFDTIEEANEAQTNLEARGYRAIIDAREPSPPLEQVINELAGLTWGHA